MQKELIIVESPSKAKTIKQYFPDKRVVSSVGHICEIANSGLYNMGIDVKGNFNIDFRISDSKKEVVKDLKKQIEWADVVYLCMDADREGEAIAYHLKNFLNIPEKKLKRATYHEVTKKAVEEAMANPRKIDLNMVNSALSRASLDKIIGFRLSPIAKTKVGAKSVGRCQSPALKLIVEREEEINAFKPETYYEIYLPFTKDKKEYKAQYKGLIKEEKNTPTIKDKELCDKIVEDCRGYDYIVHKIDSKDRQVESKPPFITSTFQQEVSSKLGYSVKTAQMYAQKLYEGINIGGQHKALCSYLRTDDTSMSPEFKETLKQFIINNYGKEYLKEEKEEKKTKKKKRNNTRST
jgi:DNA topoisomerase-1